MSERKIKSTWWFCDPCEASLTFEAQGPALLDPDLWAGGWGGMSPDCPVCGDAMVHEGTNYAASGGDRDE